MSDEWGFARFTALAMNIVFSVLFLCGALKSVLSDNFFPFNVYRAYIFGINFCLFTSSTLALLSNLLGCENSSCLIYFIPLMNVFNVVASNIVLLLKINRYKMFILLNPRSILLLGIIELASILFIFVEFIFW